MKWNPLKLSDFWTSVELPMQWALIRELRSYMLLAWPEKKKSDYPVPPSPAVSTSGEKGKKQVRAGKLGLSLFLVTPLGTLSLVTQPCSQGCSRT